MDLSHISDRLVPCPSCRVKLLVEIDDPASVPESDRCPKCTCWSTPTDNRLLLFPPKEDFPKKELPPFCTELLPVVTEFDQLVRAVEKTHKNVEAGDWEAPQAQAYLAYYSLNKACADSVVEHATNMLGFRIAEIEQRQEEEMYEFYLKAKKEMPHQFEPFPIPAIWKSGLKLQQHIDALMHLVFLGVKKSTIGVAVDWLKIRGKFTPFMEQTEKGFLAELQVSELWGCPVGVITTRYC